MAEKSLPEVAGEVAAIPVALLSSDGSASARFEIAKQLMNAAAALGAKIEKHDDGLFTFAANRTNDDLLAEICRFSWMVVGRTEEKPLRFSPKYRAELRRALRALNRALGNGRTRNKPKRRTKRRA